MLRIDVQSDEAISPQARRYAEYRVFAALTHLARRIAVRDAQVALRQAGRTGQCDGVECVITVAREGPPLRVHAGGDHPYAAINRAVERLARLSSIAPAWPAGAARGA
jgi:ribosome-associated translation inhibitor RaiA